MLVLSRKHNERLTLNVDGRVIDVVVVRLEAGRVRIGIDCDADVKVIRTELMTDEIRTAWGIVR